jgi:hypothetical protein
MLTVKIKQLKRTSNPWNPFRKLPENMEKGDYTYKPFRMPPKGLMLFQNPPDEDGSI